MYKAGLIGVTGYTGMELARILATHPQIELTHATSRQESGKKNRRPVPFFTLLQNRLGLHKRL